MTLFLFLIFIANLIIGRRAKKRYPTIILIVTSWWYLWLFVSSLSLTGLKTPSLEAYGVYVIMLVSVTVGSFAYSPKLINKKPNETGYTPLTKISKKNNLRIYLLNYFLIFIAAPVVFYLLFKSISIMLTSEDLISFRANVFINPYNDSIVFGPGWVLYLFFCIIMSPIFIGLFVGSFLFILDGRKKLFVISSILMIAVDIMMLSRFNIYLVTVCLLICLYLKKSKIISKIKKIIITLMILLSLLFAVGAMRGVNDVRQQVLLFVVDYHTLGFSLFDNELQLPESYLNSQSNYNLSSSGIIQESFFILIRRLGLTQQRGSIGDIDLSAPRDLSSDESSPKFYNAFGTIVYSLYGDGGIFFVIFMSLIYGYLFSKHISFAFNKSSVKHGALVFLYLYLGIFGIFQPLLLGFVWIQVIGINLLFINLRKYVAHAK